MVPSNVLSVAFVAWTGAENCDGCDGIQKALVKNQRLAIGRVKIVLGRGDALGTHQVVGANCDGSLGSLAASDGVAAARRHREDCGD